MGKTLMASQNSASFTFASKVKDYFILIKFTLSFLVVFSSVVSYLLAPNVSFDFIHVFLLFIAGMLITGSANALNQTIEKDTDRLMKRTAKRPVADGRMSEKEAYTFAFITGAIGVLMMWQIFNFASAMIGLVSLFLYAYIYTPLKKINSISVLVGAFPGALPCLIGWVAATGYISPFAEFNVATGDGGIATYSNIGGYILFAIQFIWQFPHFWAIAWLAHKDYDHAGFKLLPSTKGPSRFTAVQTVIYSTLMVPIGMLPYVFGISGLLSFWILFACNLWMVYVSILLLLKMNAISARKVMFSSYFYLMIVYLALLLDKLPVG